jgi:hypothetical protein
LIIQQANYVKYNRTFYKDRERREEGKKVLLEFFKVNERVMNGLTGFLIMDSESDPKERIVDILEEQGINDCILYRRK